MTAAESLEGLEKASDAALARLQALYAATTRLPRRADLPPRLARLVAGAHPALLPDGVPLDAAFAAFAWDAARYPPAQQLERTVRQLTQALNSIDAPIKVKIATEKTAATRAEAARRQLHGPVAARPAAAAVAPGEHVDTAFLTSVYVLVPSSAAAAYPKTCLELADFVVPDETEAVCTDREHTLFRTIVFKRDADAFAAEAQTRGWAVRPYHTSDVQDLDDLAHAQAQAANDAAALAAASYAPLLAVRLHILVLRLYVEAAFRFGAPTHDRSFAFLAVHAGPKPKAVRMALGRVFESMHVKNDSNNAFDDFADEITVTSYLPCAAANLTLARSVQHLSEADYKARMVLLKE